MNTNHLFDPDHRSKASLAFIVCLAVLISAVLLASLVQKSFGRVFVSWSAFNILVLIIPLILLLLLQYVPLFTIGAIPFVGPGGMLIAYTHNLFHIIGVLIMVTPISTWFYQLTGKIYLGAILNAALVTWFVSSQVIAPIPV